ncbi:hypothetical protein SD71_16730 [Cohnella kolymensis]|uniref:Uncharacterized protein n=1 Tax=Cohnella kolymensis TaxID=1590652 RepID=A0ABR5A159_9BACL|nr:hypothetical protein SD71_16730 [Cohnella kolymensis]
MIYPPSHLFISSMHDECFARLRARKTGFRAALAVLVAMAHAFCRARFAHFRTYFAQIQRVGRVQRQSLSRECADLRTFAGQADTDFHIHRMLFTQARVITVIASLHTPDTFIDAALKLFMRHGIQPPQIR